MAEVRLGRVEAEQGKLPAVCMRCGAPATTTRRRRFRWRPAWVLALLFFGVLPYIIVAMILDKEMRVVLPLCAAHANHFTVRARWVWGIALMLVAILGVLLLGGIYVSETLGGAFCGAAILAPVVWLVALIVLMKTAIHAVEITDDSITLTRVTPKFADAMQQRTDAFCPQPRFDPNRPGERGGDQFYDRRR